jgi:adenosylcobyric acid synthase
MAKTIMIQGTASNVGKSILVAGLCRIFRQDGYRVAPFKSQNMALNSYITREGLEMGRAQVVQAEAAGIEPTVDMNPILLKPTGETKSQVIVHGEIFDDMDARGYYSYKKVLAPKVKESFDRLNAAYDIIVIEGAGSPAEINLKENDIVNMYMAFLAKAPVLLAADIDRGGVFAAIAGTLLLCDEEERRMIKGILINKFRGNLGLLEPGLRQIEEIVHKPVLGVIPYLHIDIDDEDSLSERFHNNQDNTGLSDIEGGASYHQTCCASPTAVGTSGPAAAVLAPPAGAHGCGRPPNQAAKAASPAMADIAVIRLPYISNFTDFNALSRIPGVRLRYVNSAEKLGKPGLIIIPGTKNTMADLVWLRKNGLAAAIQAMAVPGTPVFGICGGYQMLGTSISDPGNVEHGGTLEGLGLLPVATVFEKEKVRTRVRGHFVLGKDGGNGGIFKGLAGMELEGYEVHMGITTAAGKDGTAPLAQIHDIVSGENTTDGACRGNVYGTYIHGIFDAGDAALALVKSLYSAKGLEYTERAGEESGESGLAGQGGLASFKQYKERQYDILAEALRRSINMDKLYQILEEGV